MIGVPHIGTTDFNRFTPGRATVGKPSFERFFAAIFQNVKHNAKFRCRDDEFVVAMTFVRCNFIETELFDERITTII
jgi:hypothetical protein